MHAPQPASPPLPADGGEYVESSSTPADRQWALWTHLAPLILAALSSGSLALLAIPWAIFVMLVPGARSPFVADHARELLNFSLSLLVYGVVGSIVVGVLTIGLGLLVYLPALAILGLVGAILAAIAAGNGRYFRYPMCVRFFSGPAASTA